MSSSSELHSLRTGEISLQGKFAWGSNHTFLVDVSTVNGPLAAVYKPSVGEQPLWDFPTNTLAQREVAAFLVSEALGWDLVPPTVLRMDGPEGGGSLQLYFDMEPTLNYFAIREAEKQFLQPVVIFDALINNADRKAGHVALLPDGHIQLIDHGLCFHQEYKLRTVIWDFAGATLPAAMIQDLKRLSPQLEESGSLSSELAEYLSPEEIQALQDRQSLLLQEAHFPTPGAQNNHPWPLV